MRRPPRPIKIVYELLDESELEDGERYYCTLSNREVLITGLHDGVHAISYNPISGLIEKHIVGYKQLAKYDG